MLSQASRFTWKAELPISHLLVNPQDLCWWDSLYKPFLSLHKIIKSLNQCNFSVVSYVTAEAKECIQTGLGSRAAPSPAFPEHAVGTGEER